MHWKCVSTNRLGQEVTEYLSGQKLEILDSLKARQLQIIEVKPDYKRIFIRDS